MVDDVCHDDSLSVGGDLRTVPLTGQTIKDYLLPPPTLRTVVVVGAPGFVGYLVKVEGHGEIDDSNRPTNDIDFHVLHGTSAT